MVRSLFLSAALLALGASAQQTSEYVDEKTGITFQTHFDTTGFSFGIALPEDNSTTDFIGQMVTPVTEGWGGMSFGSGMSNHLLVVAWPNGDEVIGSLREATSYATPPVYDGDASLETIEKGTFINSTAFSYTFLCKGCIVGGVTTFEASDATSVFGWAYSDEAVTTPTSASSALSYHSAGFGLYGVNIAGAKQSEFDTWAATAVASTPSTGSGNSTTGAGGNSTTPATPATVANSTYDYIVAGAGAAGIIVAERLAESGASVLLIERGGASTYSSGGKDVVSWNDTITQYDVPGFAYYLSSMKATSYCSDTASQAGCLLGGGTMVNALMYVKPQEADFDDKWPTGWKWSDVQDAADRLYERNPGTTKPSQDGQRYDQGAYNVLSQFLSGMGYKSVDALEQPNEKHNVYSYPPWSIQDGLRAGPVRNYLPLAEKLSNFKLLLNTNVIRAVRTNSTITGIEVQDESGANVIYNVNAGGKVILASGALSTPRILFNSGIGPADQIKIVANGNTGVTLPDESAWIELPVGKGVQDHPIFTLKFDVKDGISALPAADYTSPNTTTVDLFAKSSGLLAQSGQRINFWTSAQGSDGVTRFFQGTCNAPSNNTVQIKLYMTHGLTSSGVLGITADGVTEFTTEPWLTTEADKEAAAAMIDTLLAATQASNSSITFQSGSNATGASLISNYVTGAHFVGTAKMGTDDGRENNGTAVVDTDTKVYGTDNLFVVDASIHPDLPTGNTQAIVMVAAEAAAAKILALGGASNSTSGSSGSSSTGSGAGSASPAQSSAAPAATISAAAGSSSTTSASPVAETPAPTGAADNEGGDDDEDCYDEEDEQPAAPAATTAPAAVKVRAEAVDESAVRRQSMAERRGAPSSPERFEDEDQVEKRVQWERASYLDHYSS